MEQYPRNQEAPEDENQFEAEANKHMETPVNETQDEKESFLRFS